ncbi:VOC family protein [Isachenkonia alkalipeptolytica]|uniref:VOC family protein n=1 Tax=Isachenkonia alkalipeptolytica TaxID=2565777 RepID=A0AA44BE15_9CLOT|nr:VOC family protein [Isachenkonia alkalipeptolytica]NBG88468.1 VOC family protein [Isachenkonia alkalipeptolytica]
MSEFHQPPNIYVEQVQIKVSSLDLSLEFYEEVLGFQILERKDNVVSLTADGKKALIVLEEVKGARRKKKKTIGLYHFAILVPDRKALGSLLEHIHKFDSPIIVGASDHGISKAIYVEDPDENGIEVYKDTPPETWKWEYGKIIEKTERLNMKQLIKEAKDQEWRRMPEETVIGHIHLSVKDLQLSKEFYCDLLGLNLVMEYPNQALFFSSGGYHHHIAINTWGVKDAKELDEKQVGLKNFTMNFPNEWKRQTAVKRLESKGYAIEKLGVGSDLVTIDPSGNPVCLKLYSSDDS